MASMRTLASRGPMRPALTSRATASRRTMRSRSTGTGVVRSSTIRCWPGMPMASWILGGQARDLHVREPELSGELAHQTLGVLGAVATGLGTASGREEQRERGVGVLGRGRRGAHGG